MHAEVLFRSAIFHLYNSNFFFQQCEYCTQEVQLPHCLQWTSVVNRILSLFSYNLLVHSILIRLTLRDSTTCSITTTLTWANSIQAYLEVAYHKRIGWIWLRSPGVYEYKMITEKSKKRRSSWPASEPCKSHVSANIWNKATFLWMCTMYHHSHWCYTYLCLSCYVLYIIVQFFFISAPPAPLLSSFGCKIPPSVCAFKNDNLFNLYTTSDIFFETSL